jgi:hypothetical protein
MLLRFRVYCGRNSRKASQGGLVRRAKSKAQSASVPIPDDLRAAFRKAVWSYADWNPGLPEPEVTLRDRLYALSAVCRLVDEFHDRLAEDIFDRLMSYLREIRYTLLRQRLVADHSYAAAGQCFLRLIEDRKRHFLVP